MERRIGDFPHIRPLCRDLTNDCCRPVIAVKSCVLDHAASSATPETVGSVDTSFDVMSKFFRETIESDVCSSANSVALASDV